MANAITNKYKIKSLNIYLKKISNNMSLLNEFPDIRVIRVNLLAYWMQIALILKKL